MPATIVVAKAAVLVALAGNVDAAAIPEVRGLGLTCPSAADVAERLRRLLPEHTRFSPGDEIELEERPSAHANRTDIEVRLVHSDPELAGASRRVERTGSCGDVADAIAVVAASWGVALQGPTPMTPALPPPPSREFGENDRAASPEARSRPVGSSRVPPSAVVRDEELVQERPSSGVLAFGAFGGAVAGPQGGAAPVAGMEGELILGRLLARLSLGAVGARDVALGDGRAEWWRGLLGVNFGARAWQGESALVDVTAGPVLSAVRVHGVGFDVDQRATGFDAGFAPAVRVTRTFEGSRLAAWLGVTTFLWVRSHTVLVDGEARALPRVEASLALGLTFDAGK